MSNVVAPQAGPSAPKPPLTFEFTKRKRWADILITELVDVIIFILSPSRKVLYCGTAVTELLGWRETDLVDHDLTDFINLDDHIIFSTSFEESIRTNCELLSYVRLKKNEPQNLSPKDELFELKGYPHYITEGDSSECKCFFGMAKPYPSRNTAMLNTFLDLKMENERLQFRLAELKSHAAAQYPLPPQAPTPTNPMYATSSLKAPRGAPSSVSTQSGYYTSPLMNGGVYDDGMPGSVRGGGVYAPGSHLGSVPPMTEEESEEGSKKKKLKKSHTSEQHVCITCGRTDSPEWRKGPLGPKTLCNACGLRWAKQMRKADDLTEGSPVNGAGSEMSMIA